MPAELSAGIAQAIGVSIVWREKHQPQVLVSVGGEHHGPGMLRAQAAEGSRYSTPCAAPAASVRTRITLQLVRSSNRPVAGARGTGPRPACQRSPKNVPSPLLQA